MRHNYNLENVKSLIKNYTTYDVIEFKCGICDKSIYKTKHQIQKCISKKTKMIICSNECKKMSMHKTIEVLCSYCQKEIKIQPYKTKYSKSGNIFCDLKCKGKFSRKWENKTILDLKNKRQYQVYSQIRDIARKIFYEHNKQFSCKNCGYNKHIEVCHIKAINSYSDDTKISEINALSNLIGLCPNCHWEFDNGLLDI